MYRAGFYRLTLKNSCGKAYSYIQESKDRIPYAFTCVYDALRSPLDTDHHVDNMFSKRELLLPGELM